MLTGREPHVDQGPLDLLAQQYEQIRLLFKPGDPGDVR